MSLSYENYLQLEKYINSFDNKRGSLIIILHKTQEIFGYIPDEVQEFIGECIGVEKEKISEIVNFYSFFSRKPNGKYEILVCLGVKCKKKGGLEILRELEKELNIKDGEVTPDGLFRLKSVNCLGACGSAPVVVVGQSLIVEANVTKIKEILHKYKK